MSADGNWKLTINTPMGVQQASLSVKTEGATFTGVMNGQAGEQPIDGVVAGDELSWTTEIKQPMPLKIDFKVTCIDDALNGNAKLGMFGTATVTGVRA